MISKLAGMISAKNTRTKLWWGKLAVALVVSNVFFFLLFGGDNTSSAETTLSQDGLVEVQIEARLHTPFQRGKKVLLICRRAGKKITGVLNQSGSELDPRFSILVPEEEAEALFHHGNWEVLPLIANLRLQRKREREDHEIRY